MTTSRQGLHLHFDPLSGIAGDMAVAALVDAGVPPEVVSDAVASMNVPGLRVTFESRRRGAYVGNGFVVHTPDAQSTAKDGRRHDEHGHDGHGHDGHGHDGHGHDGHGHDGHAHDGHAHGEHAHAHDGHTHGEPGHSRAKHAHKHRDYAEIRRLLRGANFDADAKALAEDMFARIAEVEAALHGMPVGRVAFHEVGAFDSIADVVGVSAAIAWLAPTSISSSPPVLGTGRVRTAHGPVPVPAPATAALLTGIPVLSEGLGELTTPTGAAILASVVDEFGSPPPMTLVATGYGAGTRELTDRANVLRVMLGAPVGIAAPPSADSALLLQANIDDMTPQLLAALMDALFAAGALDVWATSILMKKGRPAQEVSALAEPAHLDAIRQSFFLNSTTLGIRMCPVDRTTLVRAFQSVKTRYGDVRIKVSAWAGQPLAGQPEFDDCRRLAAAAGVPVKQVWTDALVAAQSLVPGILPLARPVKSPARRAAAGKSPRRARGKGKP